MKNIILTSCLFLSITILGDSNREPLCQLVDNPAYLDLSLEDSKNPYNNGYKKDRYHFVLDKVIETFNPQFNGLGQTLKILRDWSDGAVNAWAFRLGDEAWLEVPGGMARYHLISEEGFLMTICHELGHLLGGAPHRNRISFEGQADYYAPMKCMETILDALNVEQDTNNSLGRAKCFGRYCDQRLVGIKSLTSYYAFLEKVPSPSLSTPSTRVVRQTLRAHPPAQCRFDTMIQALGCSQRIPFSYDSFKEGACTESFTRPLCWFNES